MLRRQRYLPISTRPEAGPAGHDPAAPRSGFTLVEMMVAVVILAVGLLGLVSTAGYVVRQVHGGAQQSTAATVVQSRTEWMRSIPCDSIRDSTTKTRGVTERWVKGSTINKVLAVVDTVRYPVRGSKTETTMRTYTIMVPCW